LISNALKWVGGWGSTPHPAGGAYDAPLNPVIVSENPSHHKFLATPLPSGVCLNVPVYLLCLFTCRCAFVYFKVACSMYGKREVDRTDFNGNKRFLSGRRRKKISGRVGTLTLSLQLSDDINGMSKQLEEMNSGKCVAFD